MNTNLLSEAEILQAKILIVDDLESNVMLLEQLLSNAGYTHVSSVMDPTKVAELHCINRYDLILLDMQMPVMDGFQVMESLKADAQDPYLSVIVLTAQPGHKLRALQAAAKDFISKPFDMLEVKTRIHNILEVRMLYSKLEAWNKRLEAEVQLRTAELQESEARFRCFTELASDWYWEQDKGGNFTRVSGPILAMLGIKEDDSKIPQADETGWNQQDREKLLAKIEAREPFLDFIVRRSVQDGSEQVFRVSGQPIFGADCSFTGYRGVGVEIILN